MVVASWGDDGSTFGVAMSNVWSPLPGIAGITFAMPGSLASTACAWLASAFGATICIWPGAPVPNARWICS